MRRTLIDALAELTGMIGRPACCVCGEPPGELPLYRVNGLDAPGPLWACWTHYVGVKLRVPTKSTPILEAS